MGGESVTISGTKKKKNVLKRIAKGMAFKKKKKHPDDASVLGVSMADNSVTTSNGDAKEGVIASAGLQTIQIILLLMDPDSRRFEFLQLEFDSTKALVSDILLQIKQSSTDKTVRDTTYVGVCDRTGLEMIAVCKLSMFCSAARANDIVLAIPKGMDGKETAALAKPILEDEKVIEMVSTTSTTSHDNIPCKCNNICLTTCYSQLRPCGINVAAKKKSSRKSGLSKIDEDENSKTAAKSNARGRRPNFPTQVLGILIAAVVFAVTQQHYRIVRPIQSGLCLLPGEWISQCGIWELFPGNMLCDSSKVPKLSMGRDGKLRYFDQVGSGKKETWSVGIGCAGDSGKPCEENLDCQGAAFALQGKKWYVEVNRDRKPLLKDIIQQFT